MFTTYTLIDWKKLPDGDEMVTIDQHSLWPWVRNGQVRYVGGSTFWREYPSGEKVSVLMDLRIAQLVAAHKMKDIKP